MVSIGSLEEQRLVAELAPYTEYWFGLTATKTKRNPNMRWKWTDETPNNGR